MKVAIFDFDGTLVKTETLPLMLKSWGKLGYPKGKQIKTISRIYLDYFVYKMKLKKGFEKEEFRRKVMYIFLDIFRDMKKTEIEKFFDDVSVILLEKVNTEVLEELRISKQEGCRTILLSGAVTPMVERIAANLGFDDVIASKLKYEGDYIDYKNPVTINMGKNKVSSILEFLGDTHVEWSKSRAYADSYYDMDILEKVGIPIAVNPDEQLKEIASSRDWKII